MSAARWIESFKHVPIGFYQIPLTRMGWSPLPLPTVPRSAFTRRRVDVIMRKRNEEGELFPGQADVNTLRRVSGQTSRLKRLLLDMAAAECSLKSALATDKVYHPGFPQGLVQTLYDMKGRQTFCDDVCVCTSPCGNPGWYT